MKRALERDTVLLWLEREYGKVGYSVIGLERVPHAEDGGETYVVLYTPTSVLEAGL